MRSHPGIPALLAAALAAGCASLAPNDVVAPGGAGTRGYYTVVKGRTLNLGRTRAFYEKAGADEALEHLDAGIEAYRHGRGRFLTDLGLGLLVGGLAGHLYDQAHPQPDGYSHNEFGGWTNGGTALGMALAVPIGAIHTHVRKQDALPEIQAAARAYNRARDGGWLGAPPALGPVPVPAPTPEAPRVRVDGTDTWIGAVRLEPERLPGFYRSQGAEAAAQEGEAAAVLDRRRDRRAFGATLLGAVSGGFAGYGLALNANPEDGRAVAQATGMGVFLGGCLGAIGHVVTRVRYDHAVEAHVERAAALYLQSLR